tara:strand:+ start:66 stop:314 length:249 start_codon:yes stop_codon:yes gene_type:complete
MLDQLIMQSAGRFVTVSFTKKDGTERVLTGRLGVTKHLKGGKSTLNAEQYITIFDVVNKGYRAINRSTIKSVKINHIYATLA